MSLRVGHRNVDQTGLVSLPCLREWGRETSNLVVLVESLSAVFGAEPPVSYRIVLGWFGTDIFDTLRGAASLPELLLL